MPRGARYRIRANEQLDPKTQRKVSTVLRREYDAHEVVFKLVPKKQYAEEEQPEKLEVLDLSNNETHLLSCKKRITLEFSCLDDNSVAHGYSVLISNKACNTRADELTMIEGAPTKTQAICRPSTATQKLVLILRRKK